MDEWIKHLCDKCPGLREALGAVAKTTELLPLELRFMIFKGEPNALSKRT